MATKEETARYQWLRPFAVALVLLVLAFMAGTNGNSAGSPMFALLAGMVGTGLLVYALIKRDRDRRN